jgi:16S rRNA (cytidine1402-2'-O)-methyltransferase
MPTLYLIPTPLAKGTPRHGLPEQSLETIRSIRQFVVENQTSALGFLRWAGHPIPDYQRVHRILNKKTPDHEIYALTRLLEDGDVGLFSEAGAPAVADPGGKLVRFAHDAGHQVVPLNGPSSLILALMSSGMIGQRFAFHGYLPIDQDRRRAEIQQLEQDSRRHRRTELFIEAPHRTAQLAAELMSALQPHTRLCIAGALTSPSERILSKAVSDWKPADIALYANQPAVFLVEASA